MESSILQAMVEGWSKDWQQARAESQMTLGDLIKALESLPADKLTVGFGRAISYRGYYCDLAFEPAEETKRVSALLEEVHACMGRIFVGYKGGEYMMGERTPVWLSEYGTASGQRLMGLNTDGDIVTPVLAVEED